MWRSDFVFSPDDAGGGTVLDAPPVAAPVASPPTASPPAIPAPPAPTAAPAPTAEAPVEPPPDWNPRWRELLADGDEKELKQLQRLQSPKDVWKKARALEVKMSSGELKPVLGKNPTPEEKTAWRAEHGIPESADKYAVDTKISPDILAIVLQEAHATDQTPEHVKGTLKAWDKVQQVVAEKQLDKDVAARDEAEQSLRSEWGAEYRRNINVINGLLDLAGPQAVKERLLKGRMADGKLIGSDPEIMRMLAAVALIHNPAGLVAPGDGADPMKGVESEITIIEKGMRENRKAYDRDEKLQARYRELLGVRETLKTRT